MPSKKLATLAKMLVLQMKRKPNRKRPTKDDLFLLDVEIIAIILVDPVRDILSMVTSYISP